MAQMDADSIADVALIAPSQSDSPQITQKDTDDIAASDIATLQIARRSRRFHRTIAGLKRKDRKGRNDRLSQRGAKPSQ